MTGGEVEELNLLHAGNILDRLFLGEEARTSLLEAAGGAVLTAAPKCP